MMIQQRELVGPFTILNEAIRAVPAVKYALGFAGVLAAAYSTFLLYHIDYLHAAALIPIGIVAICMMSLLLIFASAVKAPEAAKQRIAIFFLWCVCLLVVSVMTLSLMSVTIGWPADYRQFLSPAPVLGDSHVRAGTPVDRRTPSGVPSASATILTPLPSPSPPVGPSGRSSPLPTSTPLPAFDADPVKYRTLEKKGLADGRNTTAVASTFAPRAGVPWIISPGQVAMGPQPVKEVSSGGEARSEFDNDALPARSRRGGWVVEVVSCSADDDLVQQVNSLIGDELGFPTWAPGRVLGFYKDSTVLYQDRSLEAEADGLAEAIRRKTGIIIGSWYRPVIQGVRSDNKRSALYVVLVQNSTKCVSSVNR